SLCEIEVKTKLSLRDGDLILIERGWYVTHSGLLKIATRNHCAGISVRALEPFCNPAERTWSFEATVFKSKSSRGFSGIGDACPANVPQHLWGSEMRIAETRAVNRALRKAYGIGLCSVEELGSSPTPPSGVNAKRTPARLGANLEVVTPLPLRDQLRQLIRQHHLDPVLTKSYALEHLGVKSLRDATREQVSELLQHLEKRLFEERDQFLGDLARLAGDQKEVA
ncbi:MAG TPA: hypothetical protein VF135_04930, partial [Terriglobales bacterium]